LRLAGKVLTLIALMGVGILIVFQMSMWLPKVPADYRRYLPQRIAFAIATLPEIPLLQSFLAGLVCWIAGRRR
jgi:hypothetical protein